ncbi:TPA: ornithine carbamoyltransferase [Desulfurococcaceae archaeon]|nr:ornithine carbamoyltransferase [Desulfurococcaceae archaeon]
MLTLLDFAEDEIKFIVDTALQMKRENYAGRRYWGLLEGRHLALLFEKPSTRTRVAFEVAASQLGMSVSYVTKSDSQLSRGEPLKDAARVLGRYVDAIAARVKRHEDLETLVEHSGVPVINALSDKFHPTQAIADVMTILEKLGRVRGVKIAFVGDGADNVAHSLALAATSLGADVRIVTAPGYEPLDAVIAAAEERARRSGGSFELVYDPCKGVKGADVVYTDVWVSMGLEAEREKRLRDLRPYQVNSELLKCVGKDYIFMHCLPAHRGEEVTEEVLESSRSVVWDQAENKLHAQRAVLALLVP